MPVRTKVNKSEEVRKLHKSGVRSASDIVAKLKSRGIKVAPTQVYAVLAQKKKKSKKKQRRQHAAPPAGKADVLDTAVVFVRSCGGMQNAREMLSKLALLQK